ncbi:MAG: diadenylate cyclase [bacterium]
MSFVSLSQRLSEICSENRSVNAGILCSVVELGLEIAREGREGRKIGTLFVVGDEKKVIKSSTLLILDPLYGHPASYKQIGNTNLRETVKELAQLDGGFIIDDQGVFLSAGRYFYTGKDHIELPLGLGSRHMAGASITLETDAVAVVVSESSVVRIFDGGKIIAEIIPEVWMLQRASRRLQDSEVEEFEKENVTLVSEKKQKEGSRED